MTRATTKARRAARRRRQIESILRLNAARDPLPRYYGLRGEPIGLGTWAAMFEDDRVRLIRSDELGNGYRVSTIWLGMDHNFYALGGPPLIFESAVFLGRRLLDERRYPTRRAALAGHRELVAAWRSRPALEVVR